MKTSDTVELNLKQFLADFFVASNKLETFELTRWDIENDDIKMNDSQCIGLPFPTMSDFYNHKQNMVDRFYGGNQLLFDEFWRGISKPTKFHNCETFHIGIFKRKNSFIVKIWDLTSRTRPAQAFTVSVKNEAFVIERWNYKIAEKMGSSDEVEFPRPEVIKENWIPSSFIDRILTRIFGLPK